MTKLTLSMNEDKIKELKIKAINAGLPLSEYLSRAGTISTIEQIQKAEDTRGVPPAK
jgi:hypothetical protein